jgi:hypothetical protein
VTTNLPERLAAVEAIAQEIMSAIGAMTAHAEALHLAVPKHGPQRELIHSGLGDLALHPSLPAFNLLSSFSEKVET